MSSDSKVENTQVIVRKVPHGPLKENDLEVVKSTLDTTLKDGQLLVHNEVVSVDPFIRGMFMTEKQLNQPMMAFIAGKVIASKAEAFPVGSYVEILKSAQEYDIVEAKDAVHWYPEYGPVETAVGVLGMPGCTAYFGCKLFPKELKGTFVVTAAAGAVGSLVGQILKMENKERKVIGMAGSQEKCDILTKELGFDAAINYKTQDISAELKRLAPEGVAGYFDNVGGATALKIVEHMNEGAYYIICGYISAYQDDPVEKKNQEDLVKRRTERKFSVHQLLYVNHWMTEWPAAMKEMAGWIKNGTLKYKETVVDGLENTGKAMIQLMGGQNVGKMVVRVRNQA